MPDDIVVASVARVERKFGEHEGLAHLKTRTRGKTLTVYSEDEHGELLHVRFKRVRNSTWTVDFPTHRGTWERTPFEGTIDDLVRQVIEQFGWTLAAQPTAS